MKNNVLVFGSRVALKVVEEKHEGLIVLPPGTGRKSHLLGSVVSVSKTVDGAPARDTQLSPGDTVLFQSNDYMLQQAAYESPSFSGIVLHQNDMVARLKSAKVTLKNFEMLGRWLLVEPFTSRKDSPIIIPGNIDNTNEMQRFKLVQKGAWVDYDLAPGTELILNKGQVNALSIDGKSYCYISSEGVLGAVSGT